MSRRSVLFPAEPGIDHDHTRALEVSSAAGGNGKAVDKCRRRDQRIGFVAAVRDVQVRATRCDRIVDCDDTPGKFRPDVVVEPCAQPGSLRGITPLDAKHAAFKLQNGYGRQVELRGLFAGYPLRHVCIRSAVTKLSQFGDDVGVEQYVQDRSVPRGVNSTRAGSKSMSDRPGMARDSTRLRRPPVNL